MSNWMDQELDYAQLIEAQKRAIAEVERAVQIHGESDQSLSRDNWQKAGLQNPELWQSLYDKDNNERYRQLEEMGRQSAARTLNDSNNHGHAESSSRRHRDEENDSGERRSRSSRSEKDRPDRERSERDRRKEKDHHTKVRSHDSRERERDRERDRHSSSRPHTREDRQREEMRSTYLPRKREDDGDSAGGSDRKKPRLSLSTTRSALGAEGDEENELFVRLLFKKLQSVRSKSKLENLHFAIMSTVKEFTDNEASSNDGARNRSRNSDRHEHDASRNEVQPDSRNDSWNNGGHERDVRNESVSRNDVWTNGRPEHDVRNDAWNNDRNEHDLQHSVRNDDHLDTQRHASGDYTHSQEYRLDEDQFEDSSACTMMRREPLLRDSPYQSIDQSINRSIEPPFENTLRRFPPRESTSFAQPMQIMFPVWNKNLGCFDSMPQSSQQGADSLQLSYAAGYGGAQNNNPRQFVPHSNNPRARTHKCVFCDGNHYSDTCSKVRDLEERLRIAKEMGICTFCLGKHPGDCRNKKRSIKPCHYCQHPGLHHPTFCDSQKHLEKLAEKDFEEVERK